MSLSAPIAAHAANEAPRGVSSLNWPRREHPAGPLLASFHLMSLQTLLNLGQRAAGVTLQQKVILQ